MRRFLLLAALGLLPLGGQASAANVQVSPTTLKLSAPAPATFTTVSNPDRVATTMKVDVMEWTQKNGQDVLVPTSDVLAVPPIFTVQPNAKQVVRLALRNKADNGKEKTYRLILQEVPSSEAARAASGAAAKVVLRLSLPVFVATGAPSQAKPSWATSVSNNKLTLRVQNNGNAHARITQLQLSAKGSAAPFFKHDLLAYVLPGEVKEWTFPIPSNVDLKPGMSVDLAYTTNAGVNHAVLVLAP